MKTMMLALLLSTRLTPYRDALQEKGVLKDVTVDGYRYTLTDQGEGPAVVLLHGLGGSLYDWRFVQEPLAQEGFRVVAIDLLGAGESDKPQDADYGIFAQARRVKGILDALRIEKASLVGNSYGGGVSIAFAQNWPDRLDKLVLIDSVCYAENIPTYVKLCKVPWLSETVGEALPVRAMAKGVLQHTYHDSGLLTLREIDYYAKELEAKGRATAVVRTIRALVPENLVEYTERMKGIRTPTLLIWGEHDRTIPVELARKLEKDLPQARLVVYADAAHVPNQERPERVVRDLSEFLR